MAADTWQCQGRQEHGRFGSGTCAGGAQDSTPGHDPDAGLSRAIDDAAYAAVGHLPGAQGRSYERWLHEGGLVRLREVVPGWVAGARLDPEAFRARFFGPQGSATAAAQAQAVAVGLATAAPGPDGDSTRPDAAANLADLVRSVRPENLGLTLIRAPRVAATPGGSAATTSRSENTEQNIHDLASVMQSEAGGVRGDAPRTAVGFTVVNRMRRNGTLNVQDVWNQFGHSAPPRPETIALARQILSGAIADPTDGATHFYTPEIMTKEGEKPHGDTGGGLESVNGVATYGKPVRNYRPLWTKTYEEKLVPGVPGHSFKFYKKPEDGRAVR